MSANRRFRRAVRDDPTHLRGLADYLIDTQPRFAGCAPEDLYEGLASGLHSQAGTRRYNEVDALLTAYLATHPGAIPAENRRPTRIRGGVPRAPLTPNQADAKRKATTLYVASIALLGLGIYAPEMLDTVRMTRAARGVVQGISTGMTIGGLGALVAGIIMHTKSKF